MLGPPKLRCLDRLVAVALEALVPPDNFYRHLDAKLDLRFVRELVHDRYAGAGRPSIDPVVFFKLQLVMFFEGIRSERQLVEVASLHLAHRWYLGYHLDEPLPDHSSLPRIRDRCGLGVFRLFFERVVELCQEAGLVWGKELFFDATRVPANAALDSLAPRLREVAREHLDDLFGADGSDPPAAPAADAPPRLHPGGEGGAGGAGGRPADAPWDLLTECRLDPDRPPLNGYRRTGAMRVSRTDPDAVPMSGGGRTKLGYHDHYVVDGGRGRVILHALVTPADVMENRPMLDLLWRVRFRWRLRPKRAVGDTTYGTAANIRALEDAGVRAYVPLADWDGRTPYYGPSRFAYDPARDEYRCPQGQPLPRWRANPAQETVTYRAAAAACNALPGQGGVHSQPPRPDGPALRPRRLPGAGAGVPRDAGLREGDAQAQGLGRAAVRRGQAVARPAPVPPAGRAEGQLRGAARGVRPEPQALARRDGLGTPPRPVRQPLPRPSRLSRAMPTRGRPPEPEPR